MEPPARAEYLESLRLVDTAERIAIRALDARLLGSRVAPDKEKGKRRDRDRSVQQ